MSHFLKGPAHQTSQAAGYEGMERYRGTDPSPSPMAQPSSRRFEMITKHDVQSHGVSDDFRKQVLGYGLTTAEILYRRPDRQWLLQSYVWQNYDMFPKFPALCDFLAFWEKQLDGPLVSVTVAHSRLIKPAELRAVDGVFRLH
jgi:uncharacterized protein Usg